MSAPSSWPVLQDQTRILMRTELLFVQRGDPGREHVRVGSCFLVSSTSSSTLGRRKLWGSPRLTARIRGLRGCKGGLCFQGGRERRCNYQGVPSLGSRACERAQETHQVDLKELSFLGVILDMIVWKQKHSQTEVPVLKRSHLSSKACFRIGSWAVLQTTNKICRIFQGYLCFSTDVEATAKIGTSLRNCSHDTRLTVSLAQWKISLCPCTATSVQLILSEDSCL
ncbi:uncharacterized protein LOC112350734 [Selaginella moellendorffii]|uniref:uncharacterized protein LOC112350734 n=1 Tax=Selaginella moellendorffii TaxID=88036 RepID=UPI000D1CC4D3|nr:uncharacterized protein LOC112350734 [Selaginella moellendorffii]|eukprot:XP_024543258.1 uncharacterized protein LOC112350734 [Selaginella moellendorffii]